MSYALEQTDVPEIYERRLFDRFNLRFPAKFMSLNDEYGERVYLMDLSAQGARVMSNQRVFEDDHLALKVRIPDQDNAIDIVGKVVWVHDRSKVWNIGMRFDQVDLMRIARLYQYAEDETPAKAAEF